MSLGFGTVIACTQARLGSIAGQEIDHELISSLPADVDVCGENGEYHTFTFKGPIFKKAIAYRLGEKIFKEYPAPKNADNTCNSSESSEAISGFWYCDLLPVDQ